MDILLYMAVLIIPLIAQLNITSAYSRGKQIINNKKFTGYDVAREILDRNGLNNLYIVETRGNLTDHYDPSKRVVRLSTDVYHGNSVASAAVAAHECGHAIQHKEEYFFLKLRTAIYPAIKLITYGAYILFIISVFIQFIAGAYFAAAMVFAGLIFQLITLPVEFDASKRALKKLKEYDLIEDNQLNESEKVLKAAALTYVAAVLSSLLNLLRIMLRARRD